MLTTYAVLKINGKVGTIKQYLIEMRTRHKEPYTSEVKLCRLTVKKNSTKNWTECCLAQHRFPIRFVGSAYLLVRVTMVDKNKAVVCCLLATSATMLSGKKKRKRKMWSKKWYLKRNKSCDAHLLNEVLETDVEDYINYMMPSWCRQVNWGNCRFPWVNCTVLCVKHDWRGQFWDLLCCLSKLRSLFSFSVRYDVTQKNRSV